MTWAPLWCLGSLEALRRENGRFRWSATEGKELVDGEARDEKGALATMLGKLMTWLVAAVDGRGGSLGRSVGEALFLLRRRAGLTQEQVASRAGASPSAISRAERGRSLPQPLQKCSKLLEVLGVSVEQFVALVDALWSTSEGGQPSRGGGEVGESGSSTETASLEDGEWIH